MMTTLLHCLLTILILCLHLPTQAMELVSTESDPDAFIQNSVNVINGDYCESVTDLVITGPDALVLQRFYSTKDVSGWRMLPYSGWRNTNGSTKDPLKIDVLNNALGLVNTYAYEHFLRDNIDCS